MRFYTQEYPTSEVMEILIYSAGSTVTIFLIFVSPHVCIWLTNFKVTLWQDRLYDPSFTSSMNSLSSSSFLDMYSGPVLIKVWRYCSVFHSGSKYDVTVRWSHGSTVFPWVRLTLVVFFDLISATRLGWITDVDEGIRLERGTVIIISTMITYFMIIRLI